MTLIKNEIPILEYDTDKTSIIDETPDKQFPELCIMTFFREVMDEFVSAYNGERCGEYVSEMCGFYIYRVNYDGVEICVAPGLVGAPSMAMMSEFLFTHGVETLLVCGSCGVLADIPAGDVIVPVKALRDEGTSYNYLPPSRFIDIDPEPRKALTDALSEHGVPYIECATWTTDAFNRETREMVEYRKSEGCMVVDMECSLIAAVAKYRGKRYAQLLYSGDALSNADNYDARDWYKNLSARARLFELTLAGLMKLK